MIDRQLLDRYVIEDDSSAFQGLVSRHGPAVFRTCRQLLGNSHEVEDAFQATFLILIRRAPSIQKPESLNRWLNGVARRVAIRLRRRGVLQSQRERRWAETQPSFKESESTHFEAGRMLREELDQLPSSYRLPLMLCYLEGLTQEEAARRIGCPLGTIKTRLVRGRRLLRDRLDRRGVGLSLLLLFLLLRRQASAAIPDSLERSTVSIMSLASTGENAALSALSPRVAELAQSPWHSLIFQGRRLSSLSFVLVASIAIVVALFWMQARVAQAEALDTSIRMIRILEVDCLDRKGIESAPSGLSNPHP